MTMLILLRCLPLVCCSYFTVDQSKTSTSIVLFHWSRSNILYSILLPDTFSAVPSASGLVFTFCVSGLILGSTESAGSSFHVLRFRTCFQRYRGRPVQFSCFALPDSFSAIPRASDLVFCFRTHFRRYRGHRVQF
jgi:hypothetical protein